MSERDEPPVIDHNPHEKRQTMAIWWVAWPAVVLLWVWYLYFYEFDWPSVAIGGVTMGVLVIWGMEITGNEVPESWRKAAGRR